MLGDGWMAWTDMDGSHVPYMFFSRPTGDRPLGRPACTTYIQYCQLRKGKGGKEQRREKGELTSTQKPQQKPRNRKQTTRTKNETEIR